MTERKIYVAKSAGFCYGVERAVVERQRCGVCLNKSEFILRAVLLCKSYGGFGIIEAVASDDAFCSGNGVIHALPRRAASDVKDSFIIYYILRRDIS